MRLLFFLFLCGVIPLGAGQTPEEGLQRLQEGNKRFVNEALIHPRRDEERRLSLFEGQTPYAVIVTCSDSRVVPEVIFDEGLGDLFVIRVAGNIVGSTELESIEFAVDTFHPVVIVVMGHEKCGAVDAVIQGKTEDIPVIASYIEPSVAKAKSTTPSDLLKQSIQLNALNMRKILLESSVISQKVQAHALAIYGAYYNLQTGEVELLGSVQQ